MEQLIKKIQKLREWEHLGLITTTGNTSDKGLNEFLLELENEALRLSAVSHRLLRELRQTYLVNVDNDGHPKASITEIMDLWDRVNRELQIVTID